MKQSIHLFRKERRGSLAIIPIILGAFTLVWAIWFFGYEQTATKRISVIENTKNIQAIIFQRAAKLALETEQKVLRERIDAGDSSDVAKAAAEAAGDAAADELTKDLMAKNRISY